MAVPAIEARYGSDNVIPLVYHYDPPFRARGFSGDMWGKSAAKGDTSATPGGGWTWVAINGQCPRSPLPPRMDAQPGRRAGALREYDQLQQFVEQRLFTEAPAHIVATATLTGDVIQVHASASGLPANGHPRRFQIVLSEDSIRQPGMDGVRFQAHVVRKIVGDSASGFGIPITDGASTSTDQTIDLKAVSAELEETNTEKPGRYVSGHWDGYRWTTKVPTWTYTFDREKLHVVAFVQDDVTGEVFDVVSVKVK